VNPTRERFAADISTFVKIELVNTHPERSAPVSCKPVMLIPERSDVIPRINTNGPRKYPFRATYPVGSATESAPVIKPDVRRVRLAPNRFALVIEAPTNDTPLRSVFERLALTRLTLGPTIKPPRTKYPVGRVGVVIPPAPELKPPVMIPVNVAVVKMAPDISAFVSVAVVRFELVKLAPTRDTPERSRFVKFAFCVTIRGPKKYPYVGRGTYATEGSVAVSTPVRPPPHIIDVTVAPVRFVPVMFVFVNVALVRFAFVRFAPAIVRPVNNCDESAAPERSTLGPTMKLLRMT
jgi:hypothetical protein